MTKGGFTILTKGLALRYVASSSRLAKISCSSSKYFDQTHERNAREHRDRIRVYPSVPMRCDQRQRTTDATQRKALRRIVNPPLHVMINTWTSGNLLYMPRILWWYSRACAAAVLRACDVSLTCNTLEVALLSQWLAPYI